MRKVTAGLFHSVDGVVSDPFLWQFDSFDHEFETGMAEMIAETSTVILGRVSYQEWSGYWPTAAVDDEFAGWINPVQKFVASTTLSPDLQWQNARLIDGDLLAFVTELKQGEGGDIAVGGSVSVVRQLLFAGLLDRLRLMTHPVVAGSGRHLFEPGDPVTRLTLTGSQITSKGNAILDYALRADQ